MKPFKSDKGLVIIEATIVFPVMFFILFFLIIFGNVFYEKSQIDSCVVKYAVLGSQYCSDPMLLTIEKTGKVPEKFDVQPYRYIFGGMNDIEDDIAKRASDDIKSVFSLFKGMQPTIVNGSTDIAHFNNYVLYSTFSVEVHSQIKFPIRFLGEDTPPILNISSRAEVPIGDTAEFIRNTDMVLDYMNGSKILNNIAGCFKKINDFITQGDQFKK